MEYNDGLDLGLGLSCGGSSSKVYGKADNLPNIQTNDGDKTRKVYDGFKSFSHGALLIEKIGNEFSRPPDKFFDMLSTDGNRSSEVEKNLFDTSNKRKSFFDDSNLQKKQDYAPLYGGLCEKTKTSHISITSTDEGSLADNKDVVESTADGSVSMFTAYHGTNTNQPSEGVASYGGHKQDHGHNNLVAGQMGLSIASEMGPKPWINMFNAQYRVHSPSIGNMPLCSSSMESGGAITPGPSGHPLHSVIQMQHNASWDQLATPSNIPMRFGYAPVQSQSSSKEHPWGILPHPHQLYPPFAIRPTVGVVSNSGKHNDVLKLPQGSIKVHHFNTLESSVQDGTGIQPAKQHIAEEVPTINSKLVTLIPSEDISSIGSSIMPGIAADLKFDGTGSYPNLPWVSTKGSGPNGKTISGVTYRFSPTQIKIVCACHGSHMTPEEFVRHANDETSNPADTSACIPSLPSNNPAASAQS